MSKHRSRSKQSQAPVEDLLTIQLPMPVVGVVLDTREGFHELCIQTGRDVLSVMMEADREALCGRRANTKVNVKCGEAAAPRAK